MSAVPRKPVTDSTLKALWANSGGKCAVCKTALIQRTVEGSNIVVGEEAHICGVKPDSKRFDASLTGDEKRLYVNLILVCPSCHKLIDTDDIKYTVVELRRLKSTQEREAREQLGIELSNVTFEELQVVTRHLLDSPIYDKDYNLVPPAEKIRKNNLSVVVGNLITSGMMQSKLVGEFLAHNVELEFGNKLRAGFVNEYLDLKSKGFVNDSLFYELWDFARGGSNDPKTNAASLAVITYFFESCEVFEK